MGFAQHITWQYHGGGRTTIAEVEDVGHSSRGATLLRKERHSITLWISGAVGRRPMCFQPVRAGRIPSRLLWRIGRGF